MLPYTDVCKALYTQCFQSVCGKNFTGDSGGIQTHDFLLTQCRRLEWISLWFLIKISECILTLFLLTTQNNELKNSTGRFICIFVLYTNISMKHSTTELVGHSISKLGSWVNPHWLVSRRLWVRFLSELPVEFFPTDTWKAMSMQWFPRNILAGQKNLIICSISRRKNFININVSQVSCCS